MSRLCAAVGACLMALGLLALPSEAADHHRAPSVARDSHGRILRSRSTVREFQRMTGHPGGWKGHVVDHVKALCVGGADATWNMQWESIAEAKAKDRVECKR